MIELRMGMMTVIAVAGASGLVGHQLVATLEARGHRVIPLGRSSGHDLTDPSAPGLVEALHGCSCVIDVLNTPPEMAARSREFFTATTRTLLAAKATAGVGHHVLLSIVGIDPIDDNDHYDGKRAQEALVEAGPVPWSVVRTTQFHEFAEMVVSWTTRDGVATLPPLLLQPVASSDVADHLAGVASEDPQGRAAELAGPERLAIVDMARRSLAAHGQDIEVREAWDGQPFPRSMAREALLPQGEHRVGATSFDAWLAATSTR